MKAFALLLALGLASACAQGPVPTTELQMRVQGMTCESCAQAIVAELRSIEGVQDAEVDVEAGQALITVAAPRARALRSQVEAAVDGLGYEASFD